MRELVKVAMSRVHARSKTRLAGGWPAAVLGVGLLLAQEVAVAQAPIVRRTPSQQRDAQAPQSNDGDQSVTTLHVETRLVNVAVNAVDEHGAPVAGLKQEDFELLEDGKPQKIAYFEKDSSTPLSMVLAIDASESVLGNERVMKDAAKKFVRALLRDQDEMDLMDFSDTVREIVPFTHEKKAIDSGLERIERGDETALYNAIYLGSERLASRKASDGRRRVLVVISDGEDTAKKLRYGQALEQAERAGAMVFSIIIVPIEADAGRNTGGEHALIQMSEDTGGHYYYVGGKKDLEPAFAKVSDDLRTQYVLGYYAPGGGPGSSFRSIKVRLKDPALREKYQLRYRSGYYANGQ